jgi:uncharacterized protein YecE (DUF72 family)
VKCPNALTLTHHHGKKGDPLEVNSKFLDASFFLKFLDSVAPLVPKIGFFIFQFEYLNKDKMESKDKFYYDLGGFLSELPSDLPYAVEIRNPKWIDNLWFDLLINNHVAPVLLQGYWMPDIVNTINKNLDKLGNKICTRLHGEDREGMEERTGEDWSRIIRPKDEELHRISEIVVKMLGGGTEVFLNVNNHYEGSAPLTIEKIEKQLGSEGISS